MSRADYACKIVSDLCAEMGLPGLAPDAGGCLSLKFDDITVTLQHVTWPMELLTVLIDLGEPREGDASGLLALLELNLAAWSQGTMTIGLSADRQRVLGRNTLPVSKLDTHSLRATLEPMLIAARPIRAALAQPTATVAAADAAAQTPGAGAMRV